MEEEMKKEEENVKEEVAPKKKRVWLIVLCSVLAFVILVLSILQIGVVNSRKWERWRPTYERVDISAILNKESLTEEEYDLLYRQTGLTKLAIDDMRDTSYGKKRIIEIQDAFFTDYTEVVRKFAPFTYMDETEEDSALCDLKDGDIIVTATTSVSWWRYGHACIVVNGKSRLIAEALAPFTYSDTINADRAFENLADYIVLRPKVDESVKTEIANHVLENMIGIPYRLMTGILTKKYQEEVKGTQCAHFVWSAYMKYGYDLDSTGGMVVKPRDIARSPLVEVVQVYGFDLDKLW